MLEQRIYYYVQSGAKVSSPAFASIGNTMHLAGFGVSGNRNENMLKIRLEFFFNHFVRNKLAHNDMLISST